MGWLSFLVIIFQNSSENRRNIYLLCAGHPISHTTSHAAGILLESHSLSWFSSLLNLSSWHLKRRLLFHHTEPFTYGSWNKKRCRVHVFTPGAATTCRESKEEDRFCGYVMTVSKSASGPDLGKHCVPDTVFIACRIFLGNFMTINVHRSTVASANQTPQEPHQGKFLKYSFASIAQTQSGKGWAGCSRDLFCLVASYKLEQGLTNLFHIISTWQLPNHYQPSLDSTQQLWDERHRSTTALTVLGSNPAPTEVSYSFSTDCSWSWVRHFYNSFVSSPQPAETLLKKSNTTDRCLQFSYFLAFSLKPATQMSKITRNYVSSLKILNVWT